MNWEEASYYEEILILVDGWPWNLSEFDFRTWFVAGSRPRALEPAGIARETKRPSRPQPVSGNRRARRRRRQPGRRRKAA